MTLLQSGLAKSLAEDYTIDQSLRWNAPDEPELSRTWGSTGSRTKFTLSVWFKRAELGTTQRVVAISQDSLKFAWLALQTDSTLSIGEYIGADYYRYVTTQTFRDVGAWYHLVMAFDTTASSGERVKIYVNGEQISWSEAITFVQDTDYAININQSHAVGSLSNSVQYL